MSLSPTPAKKLIKLLTKMGFKPIRQRGSHLLLQHPDGRTTVIPIHSGEEIGKGLLMKILKDIGLTKEEYLKHL
jgi:predicted RNA binding protein YcfA (HicA-like mRNA interferase family)